ncbi:MAG TPA: CBS domain-containing protein [Polyangiaceae bacterium]|nr:CBS domain-containing protein [Polyangiaceae bacterium]
MLVKHCMTAAVHSIGKDQSLAVAHALMQSHGIRHLPVLEGGKLVGLVSERDLYFLETVAGVDAKAERVEQGMTQDVYCVSPEAAVAEVAEEMAKHRYGSAVVVEGTKVVGMFTTTDALELLAKLTHERG